MGRRKGGFFCTPKWGYKVNVVDGNNVEPANEPTGGNAGGSGQTTGNTSNNPVVDQASEVDKWKALSRKNENELEKARKELDQLRKASMSDSEKAIQEAKEEGRKAALSEVGGRLAEAEIKASAASQGRKVPDGFEKFLDMNSFMADDGTVNAETVSAFINSLPVVDTGPKFPQGVGLGHQGEGGVSQLSYEQMQSMTPEEIVKARKEGRFDALLNGK